MICEGARKGPPQLGVSGTQGDWAGHCHSLPVGDIGAKPAWGGALGFRGRAGEEPQGEPAVANAWLRLTVENRASSRADHRHLEGLPVVGMNLTAFWHSRLSLLSFSLSFTTVT